MNVLDRIIEIKILPIDIDALIYDENSSSQELEFIIGGLIKGDKGEKGDKGDKGDIGPKGQDGLPGIDGKDGKDGIDGKDGADGFSPIIQVTLIAGGHEILITNASGSDSFNVMDGVDGLDGVNGQDGVSATIQVGSVTGGTTASVVNSGTQRDAVFDFVLPKGDAGIGFQSVTSQQDGTINILLTNNDVITVDLNHTHPNYYKKVVETTQPSGGMLPDVVYELGTLTGATTFTFAAAVSGNLNHYYFTFTSGSTAVVPTWPASITSWDGNCVDSNTGLPVIAANKTYEVSVIDGNAIIKEW